MKLKFIINFHRRIELKEIKLLIPKILRIYNKFAWKDEICKNKKYIWKKGHRFLKGKKNSLKYKFKFKAKVFFYKIYLSYYYIKYI